MSLRHVAACLFPCLVWGCGGGGAESMGQGSASLAIEPATIDFGMVSIGVPATRKVEMSNPGDAPLTVTAATNAVAVFSFTGPTLPATIEPGESLALDVTFLPTDVMTWSDELEIDSDANSVTTALTGSGVHSVTLTWNASTSAGVIGYNVYRSEYSGAFYTRINDMLVVETTYTDFSIETCKTYYYVVTAVNTAALESGYSAETAKDVPCP